MSQAAGLVLYVPAVAAVDVVVHVMFQEDVMA
jgi:hypothetical protein